MSHFPFIQNSVLKSNLDLVFEHIIDLLALSESETYEGKKTLVSSLRKTIIIHTASIIEALLLWKLKQACDKNIVALDDEWRYINICVLWKVNHSREVIAGTRQKVKKSVDKLDFLHLTRQCLKCKIINDLEFKDIDKVRILRNKMHLGGLAELEKEYTRKDLEFCFKVAKKVKKIVHELKFVKPIKSSQK